MNSTKLICLIGPSGSGKSSICAELCNDPRFAYVRSVTTREPRADDSPSEYGYLTMDEFNSQINGNHLIEHAFYNGNGYGIQRSDIDSIITCGKIGVRPIEIVGARTCKELFGNACKLIFIVRAPDACIHSIINRNIGTPTKVQRIISLSDEAKVMYECDYAIINQSTIVNAVNQIKALALN